MRWHSRLRIKPYFNSAARFFLADPRSPDALGMVALPSGESQTLAVLTADVLDEEEMAPGEEWDDVEDV